MYIDRLKHKQFLESELKQQTLDFEKKFMTTASSLLLNSGEMHVAVFVSFKNGEMIMKFPKSRPTPRKGEFFLCMVLPAQLQNHRNWGNRTYRDLYKERNYSSECVCLWQSRADDPNYTLIGFGRVSMDFANYIKEYSGLILTFAPQRPPIDYIMNLHRVVDNKCSVGVAKILDNNYTKKNWEPVLIKQESITNFVYNQLSLTDNMILVGPPGTGKTYMIAELCARLCAEGNSVLVTALTNRALIEIAEKPFVESLLSENKIFKTNLTTDEHSQIPKLESLKILAPMPSCLTLSTFYIASGFAAESEAEAPFDYVIMDEASQAFLAMFAACRKLGKRNLYVGDVHQLSPITLVHKEEIKGEGYGEMIAGLQLLTDSSPSPIYQLTKTYRFGQRAADYTGVFYNGSLIADQSTEYNDIPSLSNILSKNGGPSLLLTDMRSGEETPLFASALIAYIVGCILHDNNKKKIAVLSCMKSTVRFLQTTIVQYIGANNNVLVDTVARVQGLTTDITIFFAPDVSTIRTLEPHLFNVATSRAREHTIIVTDRFIFKKSTLDKRVLNYLLQLKDDKSLYVPDPAHMSDKYSSTQDYLSNFNQFLPHN